jgi:membrane-associated phospholipid phosphatase
MPDNLNLNLNLDQNLNLNLNLGGTGSRGGGLGPRFNTEDFAKLNPPGLPSAACWPSSPAPAPSAPTKLRYSKNWDPQFRTWSYVEDFILDGGASIAAIQALIQGQRFFPVPDTIGATPTTPLDATALAAQVLGVLNASIDRADRALEILDQASAVGALRYWTGMLHIDASKENDTFLLMLVARALGEYVAMRLKGIYRMRRPAQVYPWIMPLIDGPDTPSFPSSHALQAHLISGVLKLAIPGATAPVWPPAASPAPWPPAPAGTQVAQALDRLASRVAENREIAGVHYGMDSQCGLYVAMFILDFLYGLGAATRFKKLLGKAQDELKRLPVC